MSNIYLEKVALTLVEAGLVGAGVGALSAGDDRRARGAGYGALGGAGGSIAGSIAGGTAGGLGTAAALHLKGKAGGRFAPNVVRAGATAGGLAGALGGALLGGYYAGKSVRKPEEAPDASAAKPRP